MKIEFIGGPLDGELRDMNVSNGETVRTIPPVTFPPTPEATSPPIDLKSYCEYRVGVSSDGKIAVARFIG